MLLIPLYHKIRIPLDLVRASVISCDTFIEVFRNSGHLPLSKRINWDIRLTTVGEYKRSIFDSEEIDSELRQETICKSLPRFIWQAAACCANEKIIDLLFDATDIEQGRFLVHSVKYNSNFASILEGILGSLKKMASNGTLDADLLQLLRNAQPTLDQIFAT